MRSKDLSVLLVEDDENVVHIVQSFLSHVKTTQFTLNYTDRLGHAITISKNQDIDVCLLDLSLPDSRGLNSLIRFRQCAPNIPVIVLTGLEDEITGISAVKEGAQDYLVKGDINVYLLIRSILYAIERHALLFRLEKYNKELESGEHRLRKIIENNSDAILIIDRNGFVVFANPASEKILQRGRELLIGEQFGFPVVKNETTEIEIIAKNSTPLVAEMRVAEIDWDGQRCCLASLHDITERKKNADLLQCQKLELEKSKRQLEELSKDLEKKVKERTDELINTQEELLRNERLASMGEIAGMVGHEIRRPLSVIKRSTEFLKIRLRDHNDEKVLKYIDVLNKELNNAHKIINDLLFFGKINELNPTLTNIETVLLESLQGINLPLNVEVIQNFKHDLPEVVIDPFQIKQVFSNIIINAIEAMEKGGTLKISTTIQYGKNKKEKYLVVDFQDSGIGINKKNKAKMFEPMFTTKQSGTGLGLATCSKIVHLHKGKIKCCSKINKGSTFSVYFPLCQKD